MSVLKGLQEVQSAQRKIQLKWGRGNGPVAVPSGPGMLFGVGRKIYAGDFRTFPDFLTYYLRQILGDSWIAMQQRLPDEARHPIIQWERQFQAFKIRNRRPGREIQEAAPEGSVAHFLRLAWDLFTLDNEGSLDPDHI